MKKVRIKKINVYSLGKILGLTYGFIGLILGGLLVLISLTSLIVSQISISEFIGMFIIVIAAPILYGVLGFVSGLTVAYIYNIVAGKCGGLEIETE